MNDSQYRCRRELTIRQEDTDKATGHKVEHFLFGIAEILGDNACRDDGVVIGYLRGIEHTFRFLQRLTANGFDEISIRRYTTEFSLKETIQCLWAFRIDVIAEVLRIHTRISGVFLLIETLDEVERHFGGKGILTVTIHLQ